MFKKTFLIMGVLCPSLVLAQPVIFNFDSEIPAEDILHTGRTASPKNSKNEGAFVESMHDDELQSGVFRNMRDASRAGVFVRSEHPDTDELGGEFKQFTYFMRFKVDELSASPMFFERLVKGTSNYPGFIRFRSQSNSKDSEMRKGTFRLSVLGTDGKSYSVASSQPWIQQKGLWYWVGVVFDHGKVTFYLDGIQIGDELSISIDTIPGAEGQRYQIRVGYGFLGSADDVVFIPNRALDSHTMQELSAKDTDLKIKLQSSH